MPVILSSTYFGPVAWYKALYHAGTALIENCDSYQKQTYRNRMVIATANGPQQLSVPVTSEPKARITDQANWRHQHWNALTTAYGDSPFFEYYEDDLRQFFTERWEFLYDFNEAIRQRICQLLDIQPQVSLTSVYFKGQKITDLREVIHPKRPVPEHLSTPPYYQVYAQRTGFLPNMSIIDLLCNMGPEAIFVL